MSNDVRPNLMDEFSLRPIDNSQITKRIRVALLRWIQNSANGDAPFKLPNEDDLAAMLGVSRTGLRDALTVMEGEGYITRRRGIGTWVNPQMARCRTRLDLQTELSGMIAAQGYTPRFELISLNFVDERRDSFRPEETQYLEVDKVFFANDVPVAYCQDRLAGSVALRCREYVAEFKDTNLFDFIKKHVGIQNAYSFSRIEAILPPAHVAALMKLDVAAPVLKLSNVSYDHDHVPYLDSNIILRTDMLQLSILRKPI